MRERSLLVVMLSPRKQVSASSLGGQVVENLLQQLESNCRQCEWNQDGVESDSGRARSEFHVHPPTMRNRNV